MTSSRGGENSTQKLKLLRPGQLQQIIIRIAKKSQPSNSNASNLALTNMFSCTRENAKIKTYSSLAK